jgi:multisubunit Na+/H+ antiporter MnhB subunit
MSVLADLVLVTHALFVGFVVVGFALILAGLALGWDWVRRPGFRYAHLAAIGIVVLQAWFGIECPLTTLESAVRTRAGEAGYGTSFIQDWLYRLLYYQAESWVFTVVYTVFGAAVALVWWFAPPVRRQGRHVQLD